MGLQGLHGLAAGAGARGTKVNWEGAGLVAGQPSQIQGRSWIGVGPGQLDTMLRMDIEVTYPAEEVCSWSYESRWRSALESGSGGWSIVCTAGPNNSGSVVRQCLAGQTFTTRESVNQWYVQMGLWDVTVKYAWHHISVSDPLSAWALTGRPDDLETEMLCNGQVKLLTVMFSSPVRLMLLMHNYPI